MLITPIKPRTVSFQLPGDGNSNRTQRAATAPARGQRHTIKSPPASSSKDSYHYRPLSAATTFTISPPSASPVQAQTALRSPASKPDLIADILDQPKTIHPSKMRSQPEQGKAIDSSALVSTSATQRGTDGTSVAMKEVVPEQKSTKTKQGRSVMSGHAKVSKANSIRSHKAPTSIRQSIRLSQSEQVTKMTFQVREQTNVLSLEHVRWIKYDVAKLREHLVKVEEEVKLANRGKIVLDARIFDLRKSLSVNQQSVNAQQKKSRREDTIMKKLQEEVHLLSRSKRWLEQQLLKVKSHLWTLDNMRKTMKTKISILSQTLELNAQNMKIYHGPVITRVETTSKQRHYANACPLPKNTTGDEAVARLCCKAVEVMGTSKILRNEIKSMVQSFYASKTEAHGKVASAVSKTVQGTYAHQNNLVLQKGQVLMQSNTLSHHRHGGEIALGMALGPHSEAHKSVSEKTDRPLSRLCPGSAMVETKNYKRITDSITRQLSASAVRAKWMAKSDTTLGKNIHADAEDNGIDLQMLRRRRVALDAKVKDI